MRTLLASISAAEVTRLFEKRSITPWSRYELQKAREHAAQKAMKFAGTRYGGDEGKLGWECANQEDSRKDWERLEKSSHVSNHGLGQWSL